MVIGAEYEAEEELVANELVRLAEIMGLVDDVAELESEVDIDADGELVRLDELV